MMGEVLCQHFTLSGSGGVRVRGLLETDIKLVSER